MESPLILVIDDSRTILKMVECHLSQAGYRVATASTADAGVEAAGALQPNLILLDHQLPGTTGDEVCRRLLEIDATARVPVVISSAMRNRAFASYTDFPNVVDQIPKPFTPDLLKTGVANALEVGARVVQAQTTGCAMPDTTEELQDALLEGQTAHFPLRQVLDFLNNQQHAGRLTLEVDRERIRFCVSGGRIQAVFSPTMTPDRIADGLGVELADLAPLLAVTLGERIDPSMHGLVKLLEHSLADPRRLRALLRSQAALLTYQALNAGPGRFVFEPCPALPPMFQAFPLQLSLPALAVEGARLGDPTTDASAWGPRTFAKQSPRGGNLDRAGLTALELRLHSMLDGALDLAAIAERTGLNTLFVADVARGLELVGMVQRREASGASVLVLEDDPETVRLLLTALGPEGQGCEIKVVRDRLGAQLLLRRNRFDLVVVALEQPGIEPFLQAVREQGHAETRFIGVTSIDGEEQLARLDALGLDGILHRPVVDSDLRATFTHLLAQGEPAVVG